MDMGFGLTGSTTVSGLLRVKSALHMEGATYWAFSTLVGAGSSILGDADYMTIANAAAGNCSIQLPHASTHSGMIQRVKRIGAAGNNCWLSGTGADTVDGSAAIAVGVNGAVTVLSDNATWHTIQAT